MAGSAPGADHECDVVRLDPREEPRERAPAVEAPVDRRALCLAQLAELLPPAPIRPEREPLHDEPVHRLEHQHFGQHELAFARGLELGGGLVAQPHELLAADRVLEALDALEDVLVIVLLVGIGRAAPPLSATDLGGAQHANLLGGRPRAGERPVTRFTTDFWEWAPDERRSHEGRR